MRSREEKPERDGRPILAIFSIGVMRLGYSFINTGMYSSGASQVMV